MVRTDWCSVVSPEAAREYVRRASRSSDMCDVTSRRDPAGSVRFVFGDDIAVVLAAHPTTRARQNGTIIPRIDARHDLSMRPVSSGNKISDSGLVASGSVDVAAGRGIAHTGLPAPSRIYDDIHDVRMHAPQTLDRSAAAPPFNLVNARRVEHIRCDVVVKVHSRTAKYDPVVGTVVRRR